MSVSTVKILSNRTRARICKPFKKPKNRFLFVVPGGPHATKPGGSASSESTPGLLDVYKYGLRARQK